MIKLGMQSTLIQYHGQYYAYKGAAKWKMMATEDIALRQCVSDLHREMDENANCMLAGLIPNPGQ
eukprot:9405719-Ditylum_brightwellii.AAC.1